MILTIIFQSVTQLLKKLVALNIRGKHKVKIKPSFIIDGNVIEERRVIANGFNKYFTSIASKLNECDNGLTIEPIPNYTDYVKNSVESSIVAYT